MSITKPLQISKGHADFKLADKFKNVLIGSLLILANHSQVKKYKATPSFVFPRPLNAEAAAFDALNNKGGLKFLLKF